MTAPTTPRDPFTDEDVRNAYDAWNHTLGNTRTAVRAALLAGTERLRAQGTWNGAIEAAAVVCDDSFRDGSLVRTYECETADELAARIRSLKRPEAP